MQLEKVNYPTSGERTSATLRPTNCLAISAKRYVLFDRDDAGEPAIRKASRHGLGHMLPPYMGSDRSRVGRLGVELWQEDLWREIIRAFDLGHPDRPDLGRLPGLDQAAATRYAVTNQTLLSWFRGYNERVAERDQVRPFNFLLTYQPKSRIEIAAAEPDGLPTQIWAKRLPRPVSSYSADLGAEQPVVFDRTTCDPIPYEWLRTYRRSLAGYHLHSESKFLGGEGNARGTLVRRHVEAWAVIPIGKEADNLEEREVFGANAGALEWELARADRRRLLADITNLQSSRGVSDRTLAEAAHVSHHTISALRHGRRMTSATVLRLARAAEQLRREADAQAILRNDDLEKLHALRDCVGSGNKLADLLGVSRPYLHRIMTGAKPLTREIVDRLEVVLGMRATSGL